MACEDKCSWVEWMADRPVFHTSGAVEVECQDTVGGMKLPQNLLDQLYSQIMNENSSNRQIGCPDCICEAVGKRELVLETSKLRTTKAPWTLPDGSHCTIWATFRVRLRKWRTLGECAPHDIVGL